MRVAAVFCRFAGQYITSGIESAPGRAEESPGSGGPRFWGRFRRKAGRGSGIVGAVDGPGARGGVGRR